MPIIYPNTSKMVDMTPMEPGPKPARIDAVTPSNSKKGNPMLVLDLTIRDGESERPRKDWVVTEGPGSGKFDQILRACGFDDVADQIKAGTPVPFNTDDLIGQEVIVVTDRSIGDDEKIRDGVSQYLKR